ncbi:hypothetical protein OKA04_08480 [Luteolibacter flavescens]|uniref:Uncharacterized protein n=1 Tax=Luteolibacter flavescens TaxID=1859460 RepID=A0ABT3FMG2_9BACT|nr:hypothetical protein [Luteolibacter flavescens]MCW1884762.1 hypothetical protein [Luteolibacter flavescens]
MKHGSSRIAGLVVILIVLAAAGWWFVRSAPLGAGGGASHAMDLRAPEATVRFDDGSVLEILGIAEGAWVDGVMSKPAGGWGASSTGRNTTSFGQDRDYLEIERFTLSKRLAGVRLSYSAGSLVMSLRYLDATGKVVPAAAMESGDLRLRLSDGAGEWLDGSATFGADDDPEGRGATSFAGWPRGGKELVFQATRSGLPPEEFRMPNPVAGVAPAAWTAVPLPQSRSGDHWKMNFSKVWEVTVPGKGKCLVPDIDFQSDFPSNGSFSPVSGWVGEVAGARGTRSERGIWVRGPGDLSSGYPMPPDEDQFKFLYRIRYTESYPMPRKGVGFIFSGGVVSADGTTIDHGAASKDLGIQSLELGAVEEAKDSFYPGSRQFTISLEGAWKDAAEKSAAEALWGGWQEWMPVVFVNGGERSSGAVGFKGSNQSSSSGETTFKWSGTWTGDLEPGDKVEIGIMPRPPDEVIEFIVDRKSLTPE